MPNAAWRCANTHDATLPTISVIRLCINQHRHQNFMSGIFKMPQVIHTYIHNITIFPKGHETLGTFSFRGHLYSKFSLRYKWYT